MSRQRVIQLVAVVVGAVLGPLLVGGTWPEVPCTTTADGMPVCGPVHISPPPAWLYAAAALVGALVTLALVAGVTAARRRRLPAVR